MKTKFYIIVCALVVMHTITHAQFVREYTPLPNANLSFECITKAHSGNYFIAGLQDTSIYIAEVNNSGNVVREKLVGLGVSNSTNFYRLNAMMVDSDFNIVIVGLIRPASGPLKAFLMKLSPALSILLHVVYTDTKPDFEMIFTDVKDYRVNGPDDAYYVSGYSGDPSNQDAVLMKLNRNTGVVMVTYNGQPSAANSTRDYYGALLLDISNNPTVPSSIFVTGGLSSGAVSTIRPWVTKHNISTLAFLRGERYLMDVQPAQIGSLYNASITKDVPNKSILYAWYGNPTTALGNHTATGLTRVDATSLAPIWQKRYTFTAPTPVPLFPFYTFRKVETDANGYIAQGMWSDGLQDGGGEIFFMRTDKAGVPIWARQYKGVFNYQPINNCFLVDKDTIFAIGYKVVAGITRGVLIKTPLSTGLQDTVCANVLTVVTADSTYGKQDVMAPLQLAVTLNNNSYPINCIVSNGTKPCDGCKVKTINFNGGFTLTGLLVSGSPTFTLTATAYSNLYNSQFVVSQVDPTTLGYPDITTPNTVCTATGWGGGTTTNFPGYIGTNVPTGTSPGVFNAGSIYRVRHIMSAVNNCGLIVKDTVSQLILIAPGFRATNNPFIILNEGSTVNLSSFVTPKIDVFIKKDKGLANIYPNPANASISFDAAGLATPGMVLQVVNGNGQKLSTVRFMAKGQVTVNTASMASGLYLYTITSNGKTIDQGKFIVQH